VQDTTVIIQDLEHLLGTGVVGPGDELYYLYRTTKYLQEIR